jgi:hypothetical protein
MTKEDRLFKRLNAILKRKHSPAICPLKGMYGRDCKNCERIVRKRT